MKIVKLDIDENSILAGIDAVALVEQPAIEEDFFYFSKEKITSEDEIVEEIIKQAFNIVTRIEGIPVYSMKDEAIAKSKEIGCEGAHEHTLASGEVVYMPCSTHDEATDKILSETFDSLDEQIQDAILGELEIRGLTDSEMKDAGYIEVDKDAFHNELFAQIIATPNKPSTADFGQLSVRYSYTGPQDSKNRKFCAQLMKLNKIFRREDINNLSIKGANQEFGIYDIFRYKGSYNCRHFFTERFYKRESILGNTNVSSQKRALAISDRILDGTTTNNPVIHGTNGMVDEVPGLAKTQFAALNEKMMLMGPLMVPNKLIIRVDDFGEEYYVYFTADTIKKISYKMMKDKMIDRVNIEHDNNDSVDDAYLVESWIIEDEMNDKSRKYGFDLPVGSWMGTYKIDNQRIWDEYVKTGRVKGFSVEGFFESYAMSKTTCKQGVQCACGKSNDSNGLCDGSHLNK